MRWVDQLELIMALSGQTIYNQTTDMLKHVFNTNGDVFLMVGSGSCAIDSCIGSVF